MPGRAAKAKATKRAAVARVRAREGRKATGAAPRAGKPRKPPYRRPKAQEEPGRPTILNEELQERILATIRSGLHAEPAVVANGISKRTFYSWKARAKVEIARRENGEPPIEKEEPFVQFLQAAEKADAEAEVLVIASVRRELPQNGSLALRFAERRWPERYSERGRLELTGPDGGALEVDVQRPLSEKEAAEVLVAAMNTPGLMEAVMAKAEKGETGGAAE